MDSIKELFDNAVTLYDENGEPYSILAVNVQNFTKDMMSRLGKYTGFSFVNKKEPEEGSVALGSIYWNDFALNTTDQFTLMISMTTMDGNTFQRVLDLIKTGDMMKLKDWEGRCTILKYIGYEVLQDDNGQDYLAVYVSGYAENSNYTYQANEVAPCMVEFISKVAGSGAYKTIRIDWDGISTVTVPDGFVVDAVVNMNEPSSSVETSVAGTQLTILSGAEVGQILVINGKS